MINLLPPLEKKKILERKRLKKTVLILLLFFLFLVFLIIGLLSIDIYIVQKTSGIRERIQSEEGVLGQSELEKVRRKVSATNKLVNQLKSFYQNKVYFLDIFRDVAGVMPEEIYLTNISLILDKEKGVVDVSLSGFSPTRNDLFELKSNIESEGKFQNSSFPAPNWVKPEDINFFVNLEIPLEKL